MSRRSRILAAAALAGLVAVAPWIRARIEARPSINDISGLAASDRLDAAEETLRRLLKFEPMNPGAILLGAQISMARSETVTRSGLGSDSRPADATLDYLRRFESADPKLAAQACLLRGKAQRLLGLLDEAEASWLEALRLDATVPEAGWLLLQEYYLQCRPDEARLLALRLHSSEPDPRDRVLLLLEPFRQDIMPPAPDSLVEWFEPIAHRNPSGYRANLALGRALVRSGAFDRGVVLFKGLTEAQPTRSEAWEALLTGLDESGDVEEMEQVLKSLPANFAEASWTAPYRARLSERRGDWRAAADDYRRAMRSSPADIRLVYKQARTLRRLGEKLESDRLDAQHKEREALNREARALHESLLAGLAPGVPPPPEYYERIAELRERMGFPEESRAWRRLLESPAHHTLGPEQAKTP
jgi:tetratricopeptide (TPR) repeat protein